MAYPALGDMFQNLGPATASMFTGEREQLAQDASLQEQMVQQQAIRAAQLKNTQSAAMNPMLQQQQQLQNAGLVDTNRKTAVDAALAEANQPETRAVSSSNAQMALLENKLKTIDAYTQGYAKMIPTLKATPPVNRFAVMSELADSYGLPLTDREKERLSKVSADKLPDFLTQQYEQGLQANKSYRQAIDTARINAQSRENVATTGAAARASAASGKTKGAQTIQDAVQSGKLSAEKAAVALYGAAQFEADDTKKAELMRMATQYEQFAMNQRNAGAPGKVDVGAMANLPTQQLPPALSGGPKPGTPENPIKLK